MQATGGRLRFSAPAMAVVHSQTCFLTEPQRHEEMLQSGASHRR